ncbi:alanine racemase, partial [Sinomonas sp. G460-2]
MGVTSTPHPLAERLPERAAVVDLEAIRHNVRVLRTVADPARVMAVVKAD